MAKFGASLVSLYDLDVLARESFCLDVVLTEAFINVVRHSSQNAVDPVRVEFSLNPQSMRVTLSDTGTGLPLAGVMPPYPVHFVGESKKLLGTLDGRVIAFVDDPCTLQLRFEEVDLDAFSDEELTLNATEGGMGISLMTKTMDKVCFQYRKGEGNDLILTKNFGDPR